MEIGHRLFYSASSFADACPMYIHGRSLGDVHPFVSGFPVIAVQDHSSVFEHWSLYTSSGTAAMTTDREREDHNNIHTQALLGISILGYKIDGLNNFLFPHARALCIIRLISAELFPLFTSSRAVCCIYATGDFTGDDESLELFQRKNQASKSVPPSPVHGFESIGGPREFPHLKNLAPLYLLGLFFSSCVNLLDASTSARPSLPLSLP
jgi:hypothetical protein